MKFPKHRQAIIIADRFPFDKAGTHLCGDPPMTGAGRTAKFIGVVVTALVVGTAVSLAVVLLLMAVAPWAAR
jgi:hypothetical protein